MPAAREEHAISHGCNVAIRGGGGDGMQRDFWPYEEEEFVNSVDLVLVAKLTRRGFQL